MRKTMGVTLLWASFYLHAVGWATECNKILAVLSGKDHVSLKGGGQHPTGFFLSELMVPLTALMDAGYQVVFATPTGKEPVMDKVSDRAQWFKSETEYQTAKQLLASLKAFKNPRKIASFTEVELKTFQGIFLPGGHAPMEDLYQDSSLGQILIYFHKNEKPTALICHAPCALLSAKQGEDQWVYAGYKLTVFSNAEEKQEEDAGHLDGHLTYYVADALSTAGAIVIHADQPWKSHVVRDRELVTGQNPMSDQRFTEVFLGALTEERLKSKPQVKWQLGRGRALSPDRLYNVLPGITNWTQGYRTLFIGKKKEGVSSNEFLRRLTQHINEVSAAFGPKGLLGYVVYARTDVEIAYQLWTSSEAAQHAFSSEVAKPILADASSFMKPVLFTELDEAPAWLGKNLASGLYLNPRMNARSLNQIKKALNEHPHKTKLLQEALLTAWSKETSSDSDHWTEVNSAWGQCAVTAVLVQDLLGGEIVWAEAILPDNRTISHYKNLVLGNEIDLTAIQFPSGTEIPTGRPKLKGHASTREYVLSYEPTSWRYNVLKQRLFEELKRRLLD